MKILLIILVVRKEGSNLIAKKQGTITKRINVNRKTQAMKKNVW